MMKVYFQMLKAVYSVVGDGIWLIHTLMYVLVTCKDKKCNEKWRR